MNKLEELRYELEQVRKELNDKGYHYDPSMYDKQGYDELMKIKPFEIKYQDVIEKMWPDEPWWKVLNYWDIFDAMAFGGLDDKTVIDEIANHVSPEYLEEACKITEGVDELKALESKFGCKFEEGHTLSDWMKHYHEEYDNGELWDFSLEDIKSGAIEPREGLTYWVIKDGATGELRAYETLNVSESCELKEGTSNFGWLREFPLLVFYTIDEVYNKMAYDPEHPQMEDFTTDKGNGDFHVDYDAYYDACDKFEQEYWDKIETAVLDESQVEELEDAIYAFNEETGRIADDLYDADNEDDSYTLRDIKVSIEPGYYEAAYITLPERDFDDLSAEVKEAQLKRFHEFFDKLKKDHGLSHYEVAWGPASNGETGYRKVEAVTNKGLNDLEEVCSEELKEEKSAKGPFEIEYWVDEEARDQGLGDIYLDTFDNLEEAKEVADKLFSEVASVEVLDKNGEVVYGRYPEDESKKKDCHVNTNAGDVVKNNKFFNDAMGTSGEGAVASEELEESKEQVNEDLTVKSGDVSVSIAGEGSAEVTSPEGTVSVTNGEVVVNTSEVSAVINNGENVSVDVNTSESVPEVTSGVVDTPDTAVIPEIDSQETFVSDEVIAPAEGEEEVKSEEETVVAEESLNEDLDLDKVIGWISDHDELYNDFKSFFKYEYDEGSGEEKNKPSLEQVKDWLSEHETAYDDFKKFFKVEESLNEAPVYDLGTRYDSANSFYGKARVDAKDDGSQVLYSYSTPVCMITKDGEVKLLRKGYLGWFSSPTTLRHVKEFLKQNGKEVGTKAQLAKMYPTEYAE